MLTKEYINSAKQNGSLSECIKQYDKNSGDLIFILENLGEIPASFDHKVLIELLDYDNAHVRFLAIKNIGKFKNVNFLPILKNIIKNDANSTVRREAVSSIGRMRNVKAKDALIEILNDSDPKIVCQAIRGLLVFKGEKEIDDKLKSLKNHENETVRGAIHKAYFSKKKSSENKLKHTEVYSFMKNVVVNGDVLEVLKDIPDEAVHLTFTSPPYYNARDYSIYPSYEAYLQFLENVFKETYRITKEGRFLLVNTSPVIVPRISRAHSSKRYPIPFDIHYYLIKMGWEFIDDIIWMKPEYSVKNRVGGFQQHRKPLGYKPNAITEYVMVYRKHTEKLLDWNMHQYDKNIVEASKVKDDFETTNVWQICPKSDKVHSAVFPEELCKRVIEYYSYKGDVLFDPFGGSGTVGRVAKTLGRYFFLTEKEKKYFEYMKTMNKTDSLFEEDAIKYMSLNEFKEAVNDFDR